MIGNIITILNSPNQLLFQMRTSIVLIIFLVFFGFCCKNSQKANSETYKSVAIEKLGEGVEYLTNDDGSLVLCFSKKKNEGLPSSAIKYLVYDLKKDVVLLEDLIDNGTIKWYDTRRLEIFLTPGTMGSQQTRDDYTHILNVDTREKVKKTDL